LLDHFRPPLSQRRHWDSFHEIWAAAAAGWLNAGHLPSGYYAEMQLHVGSRIEIDTPTFWEAGNGTPGSSADGGRTATMTTPAWAPPVPGAVIEAVFPDELEVLDFQEEGGPTLVAVLELVRPAIRTAMPPDGRSSPSVQLFATGDRSRHCRRRDHTVGKLAQRPDAIPRRQGDRFATRGIVALRGSVRPVEMKWIKSSFGLQRWRWASRCRRCRSRSGGSVVSLWIWKPATWKRVNGWYWISRQADLSNATGVSN
jgi:hypothetical protein